METFIQIFFFFGGLALLLKGALFFTENASKMAKRFGVSDMVIGLTVVAIASTLPEFTVSVTSVLKGSSGMAIGNVIGSNIANIGLVLGLASILTPKIIAKKKDLRQAYILLLTTIIVTVFIINGLTPILGSLLLAGLFIHFYIVLRPKGHKKERVKRDTIPAPKVILYCLLGGIAVIMGAQLIVSSAKFFTTALSISETTVGLTIIAVGTSLPELANAVAATLKKLHGIALGNIIGSNMLNMLLVLGTSSMLGSLAAEGMLLTYSIPFLLLFTFILVALMKVENKLTRLDGVALLILYGFFLYLKFFVV